MAMGPETKNDCAGEGQHQFSRLDQTCRVGERWNKCSAYSERPAPPLVEEEALIQNT
jgi:hypothetical protein